MLTYGSESLKKTAAQSFWNNAVGLPTPFNGLIVDYPTTQKTETYTWFNGAPMPEEWVADRNAKPSPESSFDVANKNWDATVPVDKDLIEYDQLNSVGDITGGLGSKAAAHKTSLLSTVLEAGFATACEDGQFFFDTDHATVGAEYTTSKDNDLTSSIVLKTSPTAAEMQTPIRSCFNALYGFKDAFGDPFVPLENIGNPANFVIMIPTFTTWMTSVRHVLVADTIATAGDNDLKGTFTLVVNPFLTSNERFFMFYRGYSHKPLATQTKQSVALDDDIDYESGNYKYSATWKGNAFYGQWRAAIAYTFTTT